MAPVIALLGGESSGKSSLAQALQTALHTQHGLRCALIPEQLRLWCEREGRAPRADEQAAIAAAQQSAIHTAASAGVDLVIADTTALMVAIYSVQYFQDARLIPDAMGQQRRCALTLLMGLDLPWVPDGLFRDGPAVREATDALLRHELQAAGVAYQTLYGTLEQRVAQALRAIGPVLGRPLIAAGAARSGAARPWCCEACSDPGCEHRLFTDLLQQRNREV